MAISVDGTTNTRWTGTPANGGSITSASFTPASSSLLVLCVNGDNEGGVGVTDITLSVSGGGWTWTERVMRDTADAGATEGFASIWTAPVTTGASMTIAVTRTFTGGPGVSLRISAKCYIVTGQHASPIGASNEGSSTTNNISGSVTATGAGRLFGCATDWNALGTPASTDTEDAAHHAGAISLLSAYKAADHSSGSQSINFDASGTSAADWNWVVLEILAAAGGAATSFVPPSRLISTLICQ